MSFVIEKDMGAGNPPAFAGGFKEGAVIWTTVDNAAQFLSEDTARHLIDNNDSLAGCIIMPYNEDVDLSTQSEHP